MNQLMQRKNEKTVTSIITYRSVCLETYGQTEVRPT